MIKNLLEDKITIHKDQPFYNYINGSWNKGTAIFNYRQDYTRGSGNPLSNFISNGIINLDNFLYSYFKSYGIYYQGLTNNFRNQIIQFFNDFYNNFMNNKNIIDTEKTATGEYRWDGGRTTAQITLNTTMSIVNQKNFEINKNIMTIKSNYYTNPQFIYKLVIGSISNQRW